MKPFTRRNAMKTALKAGAYSAPVILSVGAGGHVGAVSAPLPSFIGTVRFILSGNNASVQGRGFPPNLPFLLIVSDTSGAIGLQLVVRTDGSGSFTATTTTSVVGTNQASGVVNGGNIFVNSADTFSGGSTPTPTATATPTTTPTATATPTATPTVVPPTPRGTLSITSAGTTPDAPLDIRGTGFAPGRTIRLSFTSPSGTEVGVEIYALVSASGTLRALSDSNQLPTGIITATATDANAPTFPAPALASTTFTNVNNGPQNVYLNFAGNSGEILAGAQATVTGVQFTPGANYMIFILRADGVTAATIPVTATPAAAPTGGGNVTAMFSTAGFPLGTVTAAVGPAGSSSLLTFTTGQIV